MKLFAPSEAVQEHLIALLAAKGIPFHKQGEFGPPPTEGAVMLVDHHFPIDLITRRAVAKIAFNYLASVAGSEFALRSCFDDVRAFVRSGTLPDYPIMQVSYTPILFDDLPMQRQTNGHLLTVEWPASQDHILGQVTLFNVLTYAVLLTRKCSSLWRDIRQGYHFDIGEGVVKPLLATSLVLPPYIRAALYRAASLARPQIEGPGR
jgi:hypothetical protein